MIARAGSGNGGGTMRQTMLLRPGELELREVPIPVPGPGELVVRVEAALTCGTDIKTFQRGHPKIPLPAPMGHEFSGVVYHVGAGVTDFRAGDAIACAPTAPCSRCAVCRRGNENLCPAAVGEIVLGAFGDYVRLPARVVVHNVFHRPAGMLAETAAGVEPLACVLHAAGRVTDRIEERAYDSVVLLGDGPTALLFLQVYNLDDTLVMIAGRHPARLTVAEHLGADRVLDVSAEPVEEAVRDWTRGEGAHLVVECVGRPESWAQAVSLARPGGTVLLFGGCAGGTKVEVSTERLHYDEVDLVGSFHYTPHDVYSALGLLEEEAVRIDPLITHRMSLDELSDALDLVMRREAVKVAIQP